MTHGTTVQFTATITPGDFANYTAGGMVTFYNGNTAIATRHSYKWPGGVLDESLAPGTYHLTAVYPGDANFAASYLAVVTLTVN